MREGERRAAGGRVQVRRQRPNGLGCSPLFAARRRCITVTAANSVLSASDGRMQCSARWMMDEPQQSETIRTRPMKVWRGRGREKKTKAQKRKTKGEKNKRKQKKLIKANNTCNRTNICSTCAMLVLAFVVVRSIERAQRSLYLSIPLFTSPTVISLYRLAGCRWAEQRAAASAAPIHSPLRNPPPAAANMLGANRVRRKGTSSCSQLQPLRVHTDTDRCCVCVL